MAGILIGLVETSHLPPLPCENVSLPWCLCFYGHPLLICSSWKNLNCPRLFPSGPESSICCGTSCSLFILCSPTRSYFPSGRKPLRKTSEFWLSWEGTLRTFEEERKCTCDPFIDTTVLRKIRKSLYTWQALGKPGTLNTRASFKKSRC